MSKKKLRSSAAKPISFDSLPSNWDVILHIEYRQEQKKKRDHNAEIHIVVKETSVEICDLYQFCDIPTMKSKSVINKLTRLWNKFVCIKKCVGKKNTNTQMESFEKKQKEELFDIAVCHCNSKCCKCKNNKISPQAKEFLHDQRTNKLKRISGFELNRCQQVPLESYGHKEKNENEEKNHTNIRQTNRSEPPLELDLTSLDNAVIDARRYKITPRALAAVLNGFMVDIGLVNKDHTYNLVDRHKVEREMKKTDSKLSAEKENLLKNYIVEKSVCGLFFDGKRDKTNILVELNSRKKRSKATEEHITVLLQPNDLFVTHFTPIDGSSDAIFKGLNDKVLSRYGSLSEALYVIGSDATPVNTGNKAGEYMHIFYHDK